MLTDFEWVENLVVILLTPNKWKTWSHFAVNSWTWLLLRYLIEPSLFMAYLSKFFLVYAHIFGVAILKCIFWGINFEVYPCYESFFWVFIHTLWSFLKCLILVTDQLNIRLQFWLNLVSDILFVKIKKTKLKLVFIFSISYLYCSYTYTIIHFYNYTIFTIFTTNN